ncbi:MAG: amidohydrolase family protein [Clostridia bacterium]|nr:amidohydrolase family protein [Clostridia bacterium]
MLIDFHTHCFPDKIAQKAIEKLSFCSGGLEPYTDGTVNGLKFSMQKHGVTASVVLNIATNAHQQKSVNNFAASINDNQTIFAFGSVFPFSEDALSELERIKELGLKGVKLHPDYQGFNVDDERLKPLYKKISQLGLITVFHAGFDYGFAPPYGATPDKMARALEWFDTPVVAAHWGGINCNADVIKYLCGQNIYFDVSFGYSMMPRYYAQEIMQLHIPDKMLFGTDTPWHTPDMEMRLLKNLELSTDDMDKITHKNAEKLLGI